MYHENNQQPDQSNNYPATNYYNIQYNSNQPTTSVAAAQQYPIYYQPQQQQPSYQLQQPAAPQYYSQTQNQQFYVQQHQQIWPTQQQYYPTAATQYQYTTYEQHQTTASYQSTTDQNLPLINLSRLVNQSEGDMECREGIAGLQPPTTAAIGGTSNLTTAGQEKMKEQASGQANPKKRGRKKKSDSELVKEEPEEVAGVDGGGRNSIDNTIDSVLSNTESKKKKSLSPSPRSKIKMSLKERLTAKMSKKEVSPVKKEKPTPAAAAATPPVAQSNIELLTPTTATDKKVKKSIEKKIPTPVTPASVSVGQVVKKGRPRKILNPPPPTTPTPQTPPPPTQTPSKSLPQEKIASIPKVMNKLISKKLKEEPKAAVLPKSVAVKRKLATARKSSVIKMEKQAEKIPTILIKPTDITNSKVENGPALRVQNGRVKFYRGDDEEESEAFNRKIVREKSKIEFDDNTPWKCVFCNFGPYAFSLGDLFGPYYVEKVQDNGQRIKKETWVHSGCSLWTSGLVLIGTTLCGLTKSVLHSETVQCSICHKNGASIGCLKRDCEQAVHLPCAMLNSWTLNEKEFQSYCQDHGPPSPLNEDDHNKCLYNIGV